MKKLISPYDLDKYISSGYEESVNPFISESSKKWGKYLDVLNLLLAIIFLISAYIVKYSYPTLSSLFTIFVYFLVGTKAIVNSLKNLSKLTINIQVLMTLAAFLSFVIGRELEGGLLLLLFSLSSTLEDAVTRKTKRSLYELYKLSPTTANIIDSDGSVHIKSIHEVTLGSEILVKAGEMIPLDGVIKCGTSYISLAHLTGESIPVAKEPGMEVYSGSMNIDGTIYIKVTKTSAESTLSQMIQLITTAHKKKPKLQLFLDRFGRLYSTSVILLSGIIALSFPYIFGITFIGHEGSIFRSLAFLIAASPCALIIAAPTVYFSAISSCAKRGILLKGGIVLDALAKCNMIAFDKTGTLTTGKLACVKVDICGEDIDLNTGLKIAAGLEESVLHPIAEAVMGYAKKHKLAHTKIDSVHVAPGKGVYGTVDINNETLDVAIGNFNFIIERLKNEEAKNKVHEMNTCDQHILTFLLIKETVLMFHFTDEVRPNAKHLIKEIKKKTLVSMITGDTEINAKRVADDLEIDQVYAGLHPENKLDVISQLASDYALAMVGDGINDAPAIAGALVGIAMGKIGSKAAIEAANVVLLRDDLASIDWLLSKSRQTKRVITQNISLAISVIILAGATSIIGIMPIWLAVFLHEGSTLLVCINSLRLLSR